MMNEPTNSAMIANTSRKRLKNPSPSEIALAFSARTTAPVTASNPFGSTAWTRRASSRSETPSAAAIFRVVKWPGSSSSRWAVAGSNAVRLAPARFPVVPKRKVPTTRAVCGGPLTSTVTVSSTWIRCRCAVPVSIATSPDRCGPPPCSRCAGENNAESVQSTPSVGAPVVVTGLPSGRTSCA